MCRWRRLFEVFGFVFFFFFFFYSRKGNVATDFGAGLGEDEVDCEDELESSSWPRLSHRRKLRNEGFLAFIFLFQTLFHGTNMRDRDTTTLLSEALLNVGSLSTRRTEG